MTRHFLRGIILFIFFICGLQSIAADEVNKTAPAENAKAEITEKLDALQAVMEIKGNLAQSIKEQRKQLKEAVTEEDKASLMSKITSLEKELQNADLSFDEIATDIDLTAVKEPQETVFSLEQEVIALIKPTLQEMNNMTRNVRKKSALRETIARNKEKQKYIKEAMAHLSELLSQPVQDKKLRSTLQAKMEFWKKEYAMTNSQLTSASQQLKKLVAAEVPFAESTRNYFKTFFKQRGLYISQALLAIAVIFILSRLTRVLLKKLVPQFNRQSRSFRIRLIDLSHRVITFILIAICPAVVFYLAEDWVLFSFSLLILLGIAWTLRTAIPAYRKQIELFLNVGAVREGERIFLDGIPWRVDVINIYSILENPVAGIKQRIPIKELVGLRSRPDNHDEPWFPCAKGDWVILSDGIRGKVIGISSEFVKLVQRGGAHKTYLTQDFLALAPLNLSVNFRIKETIGISYDLQAASTEEIPNILQETLQRKFEEEGYSKDLLNLRVEFAYANSSSLDLVVIADFKGRLGDLYNRIKRAIQRWSVDACTENHWEIPFTQVTVHNPSPSQNHDSGYLTSNSRPMNLPTHV
ncbi:MAG: hypothetical protein CSB47_00750 [Proteobacteria bacterium]|nr:MAG: hypothetical protein CSB47_00750 [Pseudomonadota bacterium]